MNNILLLLDEILTTSPGNLIYHIVLINSIAGTLYMAIYHWRISEFPQVRRAIIGLSVLMAAQLAMFIASGLGWIGIIDAQGILPPLDRAFTLFCLIWITWLWTFPEPSRFADAAAALLSLLVGVGLAISIVSWSNTDPGIPYNQTVDNVLWQLFSLAYIFIGGLILVIRRPNSWGNGLATLIIALIGHMLYLLTTGGNGDYPGLVRLAYMIAYPLLFALPQRFPLSSNQPITVKENAEHIPERRRYSTEPKTLHALLTMAAETNANKLNHAITRSIAQTLLADLCFLIYLSEDETKQIMIASGYDLIREESLEGASLRKESIPMLGNSIERGRPLRLPSSSTSSDLKSLGDLLGLSNPGHLMSVPIMTDDKQTIGGLLLLSPYSNRLWSAEDQTFLMNIASDLVPVIQRSHQISAIEQEKQQAKQSLESNTTQVEELKRKNAELLGQIETLQQQMGEPSNQSEDLVALQAVLQETQSIAEELKKENEILKKTGKSKSTTGEAAHIENELRLTLEQVARLQNDLAKANMKVLELEQSHGSSATSENAEVIASISQELRQPMSSVIGYTDLLLGESVGTLGALQRKFVERIKSSTERIGGLIDDLIQVTIMDSGLNELKPEPVDLNLIIDNAVAYTSSLVREKNITMHLDLPKSISPIHADREALQQVLIHLLQNAGTATPVEGTVTLRVQTQSENSHDYVLVQVSDTGGGIAKEDLPRVFSRLYRADNILIQGIGDTGVGLSIAKTLTEAQHGKIWVESESGVGSTFNVLFPIAKANGLQPEAKGE